MKRSAAELKQEATALTDQLAVARKKPMNFAWLIGTDGLFLETDLKKSPDVLWRSAKKNGGGPKGAQGLISVIGKTIHLTSDSDEVPTQLPKLAKRFLAERGLAYKIVLVTPSGEFTDGEDDETGDGPADGAASQDAEAGIASGPAPTPAEDGLRQDLLQRFEALTDDLEKATRSRNKGAARKASALADIFRTQIETDALKARGVLTLLAKTVEDAISFGVGRDREQRRSQLARLEAEIDALLAE